MCTELFTPWSSSCSAACFGFSFNHSFIRARLLRKIRWNIASYMHCREDSSLNNSSRDVCIRFGFNSINVVTKPIQLSHNPVAPPRCRRHVNIFENAVSVANSMQMPSIQCIFNKALLFAQVRWGAESVLKNCWFHFTFSISVQSHMYSSITLLYHSMCVYDDGNKTHNKNFS